jgi:hypothetical protein
MIAGNHGVAITDQQSWADFGVAEYTCEAQWLTEPGWLILEGKGADAVHDCDRDRRTL